MRLMDTFEAVSLDQLDDTAKTGLHIGRQRFEFISNATVEQLYNPSHQAILLHFCNVVKSVQPAAASTDSQMKLQMKREALAKLNRQANETGPGFRTAQARRNRVLHTLAQ